jgi:hypothetical protein
MMEGIDLKGIRESQNESQSKPRQTGGHISGQLLEASHRLISMLPDAMAGGKFNEKPLMVAT